MRGLQDENENWIKAPKENKMAHRGVRGLVVLGTVFFQLLITTAFAQEPSVPGTSVPGLISFNGILRDRNSQPVNFVKSFHEQVP